MYTLCITLILALISQTGCFQSSITIPSPTESFGNNNNHHLSWPNETLADPSDNDELSWNPDRETAEQFQGRLCPERCNGTQKVNFLPGTGCQRCFPCTCDKYCDFYGTCCPPVEQELWQPPPIHRAECQKTKDDWVLRVATCPPAYPHNHTRFLCERKPRPSRQDTALPVTVAGLGVAYSNVHCAFCNGHFSARLLPWKMECGHNQFLYDVVNNAQYDHRAFLLPHLCHPVPAMDGVDQEHSCYFSLEFYSSTDLISACNVTGRWREEDQHVRKACEEESDDWSGGQQMVIDTSNGSQIYRNVFCALCNEPPLNMLAVCGGVSVISSDLHGLTQTQLLWPGTADHKVSLTSGSAAPCPPHQWKHPLRGCQEVQCSKGKVAGPGTECVTPVDRVRQLGYHLSILLQPISLTTHRVLQPQTPTLRQSSTSTTTPPPLPPSPSPSPPVLSAFHQQNQRIQSGCDYAAAIHTALDEALGLAANDFSVSITLRDTVTHSQACFWKGHQSQLQALVAEGRVTSPSEDNATQRWERGISEEDQSSAASFLEAVAEVNLIASGAMSRTSAESLIRANVFFTDWTVPLHTWTVQLKAFDLTSGLLAAPTKRGGDSNGRVFPYRYRSERKHPLHGLEYLFLPFSGLLLCQHLSFDGDEFEVEKSEGKVNVRFPNYLKADGEPVWFDARAFASEVRVVAGKELVMCLTVCQRVFPENVTVVQPGREVSLTRQVISVVCSSLSIGCLTVTFLTYCFFRDLHSLPGFNNMGLSFTLALAQLSLLIPGIRSTERRQACRVVGMGTHWLWLMALLWMGVGCLHMARVFLSKTRRVLSDGEVKKAFLKNILLTVFLSAGIVLLTVVIVVVTSGGSSVGYGGELCFLDTGYHRLVMLAFLLPLGVVVLVNLVCFLFTVLAIMRVRRLQAQEGKGGRDILVYAKLSTVTGASWLFSLLAQWSGQEWMLVLAELCTASQGLLLFLAYVCNARVWRLYRARCRCCCSAAQLSVTSSSATAVLSSSPDGKRSPAEV